ncbi:MAG TPA: response regulator [Acidimicrobiia bacterium]|nr:response regulator [Acidimicrobiia bacterium]
MNAAARPALFVVEDHDIVRFGIERLLEARFRLVGSADEVGSAVELIRERNPDVVLLDVAIPGGGGAVVIEAVRRTHPGVKFLAFTVSTSRHDVVRLMRAGASGYVVKSTDRQQLADLIDQVLAGGLPISPEVAGYLLDIDDEKREGAEFARLTEREREVATYIARGYTYREAAETLQISVKTLETHLHHIFAKLGVRSRHELSQVAYQTGFVQPGGESATPPTGMVTFLLTEIVGSARLWAKNPAAMPRLLARHDRLLAQAITAGQGWVVKSTGDGILGVFERAGWAVRAAIAAQEAMADDGSDEAGHLAVRMAIVTGETDEHDGDYSGPVLNEAARMLEACPSGRVLASAVTRAVVGDALPEGRRWRQLNPKGHSPQGAEEPLFEPIRVTP